MAMSESRVTTKSVVSCGRRISAVTSSCTTGAVTEVDEEATEIVEGVEVEVVLVLVLVLVLVDEVVMVGMTTTDVVGDEVVVDSSGAIVDEELELVVAVPTARENIAVLAKLYESPVQVAPNGLSRPYAYI